MKTRHAAGAATPTTHPHLRRWLAVVFVVAGGAAMLGIAARATYGARTTADEPQYLLTAASIADDGDLDIADELAAGAYLPYHELPVDRQTRLLDDGREVSPHDPLLPALLAAPMAVGGWVAAKATLALLSAGTAALAVWIAVRRFGVAPPVAALAVGAASVGVPLAPYGTQVYPEVPAALAVLVGLAALTRSPVRWTNAAVAVGSIVALPWLAVKYVPLAAVLTVALLLALRGTALLGPAIAAVAVSGGLYIALHRLWYGGWTVYASGDHFETTGEFSVVGTEVDLVGRSRRLVGLLVDREFGIAIWNPVWLIAPLAFGVLVARRPPSWALVSALVVVGWLNATFVALTMHGWWVPGRQIVVVAPLVAIAIAVAAQHHGALRPAIAVSGALGAASWARLAIEASTGRRTLVVDFMDTGTVLGRLVAPLLPSGLRATPVDTALLLVWSVAAISTTVLGWARSRPHPPGAAGAMDRPVATDVAR